MYRLSKSVRKALDEGWEEQHGTPPPWTAVGKRYHDAQRERERLIANPPPIHGDARFMSGDELRSLNEQAAKAIKNYDGKGIPWLYLGNGCDVETQTIDTTVASFAPGHLLTIAATRSGKGTSHIVPNLLYYGGSMVVIDPKGENYALTHQRRRECGRVIRIDPFQVTKPHDPVSPYSAYNPMEFVDGESEAKRLASSLLGDAPKGEGKFWHDEATNLLSAVILAGVSTGRDQISLIRDVLTNSNLSNGLEPSALQAALSKLIKECSEPGVKRRLQSFIGYSERMQSSILATINAAMSIWDTPEIAEAVSRTDLPFGELKNDVATVYIVLPFDKLGDYGALLRLMVTQFNQAMIKGNPVGGIPVACLIDEFPALGSMKELVRALSEVAGYGVRYWLFVQSLNQLKALYPDDWGTILSQCATVSVFGITDGETVEWLGKELGQRTQALSMPGVNIGGGGRDKDGRLNVNAGANHGVQLAGTPLASPGEIREYLGVGQPLQIVFLSGKRPILSQRVDYYDDENLASLAGKSSQNFKLAEPVDFRDSEYWVGVRPGFQYDIRDANDDV